MQLPDEQAEGFGANPFGEATEKNGMKRVQQSSKTSRVRQRGEGVLVGVVRCSHTSSCRLWKDECWQPAARETLIGTTATAGMLVAAESPWSISRLVPAAGNPYASCPCHKPDHSWR